MTVGIAAIAENDDDPYVIVAADRMVTVGQQGGVEYEDTESKVEPVLHSDEACAVIVGAGPTTYIDEIVEQFRRYGAGEEITTTRGALRYTLAAYQQVIRDSIDNQILAPFGYRFADLNSDESSIPVEIQKTIAERILKFREAVGNRVRLLVAGVGEDGPGVFLVSGGDFTNYSDMGYTEIGTGGDSARLTMIRREYDKSASLQEGVFTVLEAKSQSEERQGVGQQMDMALVQKDSIRRLDSEAIANLRDMLEDIEDKEQQAREKVMHQWDVT